MSQKKIKNTEKRSDDLDPNQDEFISKTTSVFDWAYEHRRPIGLLIAVALIGSVAGIALDRILAGRAAEESKLLGQGLEAAVAEVIPPAEDGETSAKPEGVEERLTFASQSAQASEAMKRWKEVVSGTSNSIRGIGQLGVAAAHFELGEYDKAVEEYEELLSSNDANLKFLRSEIVEGLGYALEASGKVDAALKRIEALITETEGEARKSATYQAGRLAQLKGDKEAAKKYFKEVMAAYSDTEQPSRLDVVFVQARSRLLQLDPSAKVPDMPAGGMGAFDGMDPRILQQLMQARGAGAS